MGWNDHIDSDLHEAIEDLVEEGHLERDTPAYGIAQQVIHQGHQSLTERQRVVYSKQIEAALVQRAEELRLQRYADMD